jgi:signal transduction histidine kinase
VPIVVDGRPVAEVASMVDFERLPTLLAAVASATRLAADHARLRSDLRREIDLLAASRRRLLTAADRERAELADQLEREAGHTLTQIRGLLERMSTGRDDAVDDAARRSMERVDNLESDFDSLAAGLGPTALSNGGLEVALEQLADAGSVPVTLALDGPIGSVPSIVASTIYFVCAEGIANAVKHARANRVWVTLESSKGCWVLRIMDDGCGGADMSTGSGLQRLADRVGALGGQLHLESPVGAGTRLIVELPRR